MYVLDDITRQGLDAYKNRVATINGAEGFAAPFNVTPAKQQTLIEAYQKEADFLSKVNMVMVKQASGSKLALGNDKRIASNTDTRIQPRRPTAIGTLTDDDYLCTQTDYDVAYDWSVIDNWGAFSDFQQRLARLAVKAVAQDKQIIGFNGTHRAKTTNKELYPELQDVNVGWLQKIRNHAPERYIESIKVGAGHEFKTIDALVEMAVNELIAERFRQNTDLIAITSAGLVSDKYLSLINQVLSPTEQIAANGLYQKTQLGTRKVDTPAYFPTGALLITSYDNLSIYQQRGTLRRFFRDEPEWNRTADYQSVNECFVVEDYDKVAFIGHIEVEG